MATNPATVADVAARFPRDLTARETTFGTTLLGDAWADLQDEVADLDDRLDVPEVGLSDKAKRVLAQAVVRVLLNPYGRKQESRAIDDANRSWTLSDGLAAGELYFTDAELDSLRSGDDETDPNPGGKAFSVIPS